MLLKGYLAVALAVIVGYGAVGLMGWEFGHPESGKLPANVAKQPRGYRTHHYVHGWYRGGK